VANSKETSLQGKKRAKRSLVTVQILHKPSQFLCTEISHNPAAIPVYWRGSGGFAGKKAEKAGTYDLPELVHVHKK